MSRYSTQLSFTGKGLKRPSDKFGGSLLKGNPKGKRPLESKMPMHLVLRAKKSTMRRPSTFGPVNKTVHRTAAKYGVKIFEFANVGNHLHMVIQIRRLKTWSPFIRELTSRIAALCRGSDEKFWLYRPYTRIVRSWGVAFQMVRDYVELNRLEAEGHIRRSETKSLNELRLLFSGWDFDK